MRVLSFGANENWSGAAWGTRTHDPIITNDGAYCF